MSDLRKGGSRTDFAAYHRLQKGLKWYRFNGKIIRFLTLTGVENVNGYRKNFDTIRRYIRRRFGTFEYFCVRTREGKAGVLHILYIGKSFRYKELKRYWQNLTGFWTVSISSVKNFEKIVKEMTRQKYVARYSQSRKWFREEYQTHLFGSGRVFASFS